MRKSIAGFLAVVFAFVFASKLPAQTQSAPPTSPHHPSGTATDISSREIESLVQKTAADRVSDQAIRVVSINGEYNVGIGVVHRGKTSGAQAGGGIEHSQITEIYHVIEGHATLVTGRLHGQYLGVSRRSSGRHRPQRPEHAWRADPEWREPQDRPGRRGHYPAGYAALVQRNQFGSDCLLGGAD